MFTYNCFTQNCLTAGIKLSLLYEGFFLFTNITACCICVFKGKALHTNVPLNDKMCLGMNNGMEAFINLYICHNNSS